MACCLVQVALATTLTGALASLADNNTGNGGSGNSTAIATTSSSSADDGTNVLPLTAVQLLWVNLIMDTMGALALGTEVCFLASFVVVCLFACICLCVVIVFGVVFAVAHT